MHAVTDGDRGRRADAPGVAVIDMDADGPVGERIGEVKRDRRIEVEPADERARAGVVLDVHPTPVRGDSVGEGPEPAAQGGAIGTGVAGARVVRIPVIERATRSYPVTIGHAVTERDQDFSMRPSTGE